MASTPPSERFWDKVEKRTTDECWTWKGSKTIHGYGAISYVPYPGLHSRNKPAHRVSWEIHHGPIPDGLHVLHKCDNPPCVNPAHLFLGTPGDNNQDRHKKGRTRKGSELPQARLTEEAVRYIKHRLREGESQTVLARHFGVYPSTVHRISIGYLWKHVE